MTKQNIPIIFIHKSNSEYLQYSLKQAKRSNPDNDVYLIGDEENDCYPGIVEHFNISEYMSSKVGSEKDINADGFDKIFKNYSSNSRKFELFCFQRWYILREFMAVKKINTCLYLDSDCMLYASINSEINKFKNYNLTISNSRSPHFCYIRDFNSIDRLVRLISDVYRKKNRLIRDSWVHHFLVLNKNGELGGVCDMAAFNSYHQIYYGTCYDIAGIHEDESTYDHNINDSGPDFEMENGIKKISWENGIPYCNQVSSKRMIKFNLLHFQGAAKKLMRYACQYKDINNVVEEEQVFRLKESVLSLLKKAVKYIIRVYRRVLWGILNI